MARTLPKRRAASDSRLGERLVKTGVIDGIELRAMLSVQCELRAAHRRWPLDRLSGRYRLGRLLVESGVIDEATLAKALQRTPDRERRLMAIALSSVVFSSPTVTSAADSTSIQVVASVMTHASIESQRLPAEVMISAADVERGYVDIAEPVEIGIRSNQAVMLGFAANSRDVARIDVKTGDTYVAQRERGLRARTVSFRLRLKLAPGARPGRIAFPVGVSLTPA